MLLLNFVRFVVNVWYIFFYFCVLASMSNQSFSSMQPSTSGRSTSAGSETPDEGNNPQHLEVV